MKKFNFNLQPVLEKRITEEEERQRALGEKLRALEQGRSDFVKLIAVQDDCNTRLSAEDGEELQVHERRQLFLYLNELRGMIQQCQQLINEAEASVEAAREALLVASREKKAVLKLKEKKMTEHKKEIASSEQKAMDDNSIAKFNRKDGMT